MKAFKKDEFLLAVLMGLLVLLFVHTGSDQQDPADERAQTERSVRYVKVFLGTVVVVYMLLYLLNNSSTSSKVVQVAPQMHGGSMTTNKILNDSIETLMKNIDLCDPKF